MKKIVALLVILATCLFAVTACGGANEVDTVGAMFEASKPTKTYITYTQTFGDTTLEGVYELRRGTVNGKEACVYTAEYEELVSVEEGGATEVVLPDVVTRTEKLEYLEGKGVRENGGSWDSKAENFASEAGPMSLKLNSDLISNYTYEGNTLRCAVAAKNTAEVLGLEENLSVDATITIIDDGASITDIIISYTIPEDTEAQVPETTISIVAKYTYDLEKIEIK